MPPVHCLWPFTALITGIHQNQIASINADSWFVVNNQDAVAHWLLPLVTYGIHFFCLREINMNVVPSPTRFNLNFTECARTIWRQ